MTSSWRAHEALRPEGYHVSRGGLKGRCSVRGSGRAGCVWVMRGSPVEMGGGLSCRSRMADPMCSGDSVRGRKLGGGDPGDESAERLSLPGEGGRGGECENLRAAGVGGSRWRVMHSADA